MAGQPRTRARERKQHEELKRKQAEQPVSEPGKVWAPHKGPQERFLASTTYEVLYGGAAGGGKSNALLCGALRYIHESSYRALLLRRTFPELERYLIDRSHDYYRGYGGKWNGQTHTWTFPSGARIEFGHLEHEKSKHQYQTAEYQFIGWDELTHFTEGQYLYLLSRIRSAAGLPCYSRAATNPGGPEHEWVLRRWAPWLYPPGRSTDEYEGPYAEPGRRLWFRRDPITDVEEVCDERAFGATSRTFIPARLSDNPTLMAEDPAYETRLRGLCKLDRAHLLDGDWLARPAAGLFFDRSWFEVVRAVPAIVEGRVRYWDRAASVKSSDNPDPDWTVGLRMARDTKGLYYVEDVIRKRLAPHEVVATILQTAALDEAACPGTQVVLEQDPGAAGKFEASYYARELAGYDVRVVKPTGDKQSRAKPVSAQCEASNVKLLVGRWAEAFLNELEAFPDGHDDQVDALSGAFSQLALAAGADATRTGGRRSLAGGTGGF